MLGIEEDFEDERQQKQIKSESNQFNDKLSDKLDDISDEDDDFFKKTNDEQLHNENKIKLERNLDSLDNDSNLRNSISLDNVKMEKYESSISSTEDLDL